MLLESTRYTKADLAHWRRMEALDAKWCRLPAFHRKVERAKEAIDAFVTAHDGGGYVGVSWGKDSVVVAHLAQAYGLPVVWIRVEPIFNPDCPMVRAAFESMTGIVTQSIVVSCTHDENGWHATGTLESGFASASAVYGDAYISGVRADESRMRKLRFKRWGESTTRTCAPLSTWSGEDVFAYLYLHGLPVHPAYACTMGGRLDRVQIRVASIGGVRGTGVGRREWELAYYPEMV
jgi:phosphoadenosine phosphosulfate reductase